MSKEHFHEFDDLKIDPKHRVCPRCEEGPPTKICDCGEELCAGCATWTEENERERRIIEECDRRDAAKEAAVDAAIDAWKEARWERDR